MLRVRACNCCRDAHSACDPSRPCRRCVRTGRAHLCSDTVPRKRGRRPNPLPTATPAVLLASNGPTSTTSTTSTSTSTSSNSESPSLRPNLEGDAPNLSFTLSPASSSPPPPPSVPSPSPSLSAAASVPLSSSWPAYGDPGHQPYPPSPFHAPHPFLYTADLAHNPPHLQHNPLLQHPFQPPTPHHAYPPYLSQAPSFPPPPPPATRPPQPSPNPPPREEGPRDEGGSISSNGRHNNNNGNEQTVQRLEQVVETLMGEVQGLKRLNQQLHDELRVLQSQQNEADRRVAHLLAREPCCGGGRHDHAHGLAGVDDEDNDDEYSHLQEDGVMELDTRRWNQRKKQKLIAHPATSTSTSSSLSSSSSPSCLSLLLDGVSPASEARRLIPFVATYQLPATFAIPDWEYPVMACTFGPLRSTRSPTIVYVNAAFVRLTEFSQDELLGAPITKVRVTGAKSRMQMVAHLTNKTPMTVSPVYHINCLIRCRSGRLLRTEDNTQFFFDAEGNVKHAILCPLTWVEGNLRADEQFDVWLPLVVDSQEQAGRRRAMICAT